MFHCCNYFSLYSFQFLYQLFPWGIMRGTVHSKDIFTTLRLRSIVKSGFECWNPDFAFSSQTRSPKVDFNFEKSVTEVDLFKKSESGFHGFPSLQKGFAKLFSWTVLLSANYVCACETAVLENGFSNPFMDFQKKKRKRKERKSPKTLTWQPRQC